MNINKIILTMIIVGVMAVTFGCSDETSNYSPEQMINHAMEDEAQLTYYSESTSTITEDGDIVELANMKEWRTKDGEIRIESENEDGSDKSISVNDRTTFITYMQDENKAMIIDDEEALQFNHPSAKEQVDFILDMIQDSHEIENNGEEKIAGRDTVHLTATPKEDGELLGQQDIWIDKENWLILKSILILGNQEIETVMTTLDLDPGIPEDTFVLDLPDDVEIMDIDAMSNTEEVTLEEAKEALGTSFYTFLETDGLELETIEMDELTGELARTEINLNYNKDSMPYFSLAVFESPEDVDEDFSMPNEEPVTIRGQEGTFTDMDGFRGLVWQEDGLTYSMILTDPDITLEEMEQLTDDMTLVE